MASLTVEEQKDLDYQIGELSSFIWDIISAYANQRRREYFQEHPKVRTESSKKRRDEKAGEVYEKEFDKAKADGLDRFIKIRDYINKLQGGANEEKR